MPLLISSTQPSHLCRARPTCKEGASSHHLIRMPCLALAIRITPRPRSTNRRPTFRIHPLTSPPNHVGPRPLLKTLACFWITRPRLYRPTSTILLTTLHSLFGPCPGPAPQSRFSHGLTSAPDPGRCAASRSFCDRI